MIRIITSLAALIAVSTPILAEAPTNQVPKLVVGITIDQLRGDYLQLFKNTFTERGFNRLLNEGLVYSNVKFDFPNLNESSTIATIYTGTSPSHHGIASSKRYLTDKKQEVSVFEDKDFMGNYTQDRVSPKSLIASTVTDELKIATGGRSQVFSFAPNFEQALITAGYSGNSAFWIDSYSGKWSSSTYYKGFHWTVDENNRSPESPALTMWGKNWTPLLDKSAYEGNPYGSTSSFQQNLGSNKDTYILYKQTPLANEAIVNMASMVMEKAEMGKSINPDFLSITLYAGRYKDLNEYSLEIQDNYTRLDRSLAKLLDDIDQKIGLKNVLIFVTSTGYFNRSQDIDENIKLASGVFYPDRCHALLNMYLMAIYGRNHEWVDTYYDGQIFLNRKLIKEKEIPLEEIQAKAAKFVSEFSGVQGVYYSTQLETGNWNPRIEAYRKGIYAKTAGDIFIELVPGYTVDNKVNAKLERINENNFAVNSPIIFFGGGIKTQKVARGIRATHIAPSISHRLRIRAPNAADDEVLPELF